MIVFYVSCDLLHFINKVAGHDNSIYLPTDIMCLVFNSSSWMCTWVLCESSSWTHTQMYPLLLRSALFVFVYWVLSGLDNGEMGLLILSAHGAMTARSSFALMGRPISDQLMQEVVVWGWRSTGLQEAQSSFCDVPRGQSRGLEWPVWGPYTC